MSKPTRHRTAVAQVSAEIVPDGPAIGSSLGPLDQDAELGPDVDLEAEDVRLPSGRRLTQDAADELVEEVRRSAGRPSLTGRRQASPPIAVRVPDELRDELLDLADDDGVTLSQLARTALEEYAARRR